MALIKCPECGREVSDKAPQCIHCGYPLTTVKNEPVPRSVNSQQINSGKFVTSNDRMLPGSMSGKTTQTTSKRKGKNSRSSIVLLSIVTLIVASVIIYLAVANGSPSTRTSTYTTSQGTTTQSTKQKSPSSSTTTKSTYSSSGSSSSGWTPPDNPCVWCNGTGWGSAHKENGVVVVDSYCSHCNGTGKR